MKSPPDRTKNVSARHLDRAPLQMFARLALLVAAIVPGACDHGLSPDSSGFSGKVAVSSAWPPADSLFDFRVVAFREYPPADILASVLAGKVDFSDRLLLNVPEQSYILRKDGLSGTYKYIIVAQQYADNPLLHWRVVGVYARDGDVSRPTPLTLEPGRVIGSIDITVDFTKLPPQPF
jgi:hypothetical protein